jgi:hypothetical protein
VTAEEIRIGQVDGRERVDELNQSCNMGKAVDENKKNNDAARGSSVRLCDIHVQTE